MFLVHALAQIIIIQTFGKLSQLYNLVTSQGFAFTTGILVERKLRRLVIYPGITSFDSYRNRHRLSSRDNQPATQGGGAHFPALNSL